MKVYHLLKIKKEERLSVALFLLWQMVMHIAVISHYYSKFSVINKDFRKVFIDNFHISGFDPLTLCVVTDWTTAFDVNRHPLLAFYYYPVYLINQLLMSLTEINCGAFLVSCVLLISSVYAFLFMMRIGKELICLSRFESSILAFFLFSFAYVMLAAISPDHFIISLCLLLLVLYITGKQIKEGRKMKKWQTILLFFLTAGVSLNNGIKVFLASFFSNGKSFFRPSHLFIAILLPAAVLCGFSEWEYNTFVADSVHAGKVQRAQAIKADKAKMLAAFRDTTQIKDSAKQAIKFKEIWRNHRKEQLRKKAQEPQNAHSGKPMSKERFLNWTDITTSRSATIVENLFGESLQLHEQHTLGDVMRDRPVIVRYSYAINYIVEGIIILLFIMGLWAGKRSKFLWLAFSFFAVDMLLHLGLGFGINEIYIMTAHWAYAIPISSAYLISTTKGKKRICLVTLISALTLYLISYNTALTLLSLH